MTRQFDYQQEEDDLKSEVYAEYNIEGNPIEKFTKMVLEIKPTQVTLVPDSVDQLTSNAGWDTKTNLDLLKDLAVLFRNEGIRSSIFVDTEIQNIDYAAESGVDRIELYTGPYAWTYNNGREEAIHPYVKAAERALELGLEINAGHDLSLDNLAYFKENIPKLDEVSIGHALISDALYYGLENTIQMYKRLLA